VGPAVLEAPAAQGDRALQVGQTDRAGEAAMPALARTHLGWQGGRAFTNWRADHWWHGSHGGRHGAWWIVGPDWYWYPNEVAIVPDPYTPGRHGSRILVLV
jgi:hypothetical protein